LKLSNADGDAKEQRPYVQLYRSGIVEAVNSTIRHSEQLVVFNLEESLAANLLRLISDLARTGIEPPYAVLVSILGVQGARMNLARGNNPGWYDDMGAALDRDQYHFEEVIVEAALQDIQEAATIIRPILDQIANASGEPASRSFDQRGRYIPLRS
jgi:hypothetical protein